MRRKLFHEEANYRVKGQNLLSLVNPAAMISLVHFNLFQMPLSISGIIVRIVRNEPFGFFTRPEHYIIYTEDKHLEK